MLMYSLTCDTRTRAPSHTQEQQGRRQTAEQTHHRLSAGSSDMMFGGYAKLLIVARFDWLRPMRVIKCIHPLSYYCH